MLNIGDIAPDFTGTDLLTGAPFTLSKFDNYVVLLTFNGLTYCGPCQFMIPEVEILWKNYLKKNCKPPVQFVGVSVDDSSNLINVLQAIGVSFPFFDDPSIVAAYEVSAVPTLFIIKPGRKICFIKTGLISPNPLFLKWILRSRINFCGNVKCNAEFKPPYFEAVARILFGVTQDGGGVIIKGDGPVPIDPWDPLLGNTTEQWDMLLGMAMQKLASQVSDPVVGKDLEIKALQILETSIRKQLENTRNRQTDIKIGQLCGKEVDENSGENK